MLLTKSECIDTLNTTKQIGVDGTFNTTPKGFYQIVSVHALTYNLGHHYMILCVQILLPNKERETYILAFKELLQLLKPAKELCINVIFLFYIIYY